MKNRHTIATTASITPITAIDPAGLLVCPISRMTVAIAPGPAIRGVARGNTEGSGMSATFFPRRFERRSNSMSNAVSSNKIPPAIWKAGIEMPIKPSTASPNRAKASRMQAPITEARSATPRRCLASAPLVKATNKGVSPIGSMTTKSAANAVIRNAVSKIMLVYRGGFRE